MRRMLTIYRLVYDFADGSGELRMIMGHPRDIESTGSIASDLIPMRPLEDYSVQ